MNSITMLIAAVVIGVLIFLLLFKAVAKVIILIIVVGVIYAVFHAGFIMSAEELGGKSTPIIVLFREDHQQKIIDKIKDFAERRDQSSVIDTEALRSTAEDIPKQFMETAQGKFNNIDKHQLMLDINGRLETFKQEEANKAQE